MDAFVQLPVAAEPAPPRPPVRELALSAAWNGGLVRELTTTSGDTVQVVYRGRWSHGSGPDFVDAMVSFNHGPVITGDVEIHLQSSDWTRHGHEHNPAYNAVALHIVARNDSPDIRRADGALVPTVVMNISDADLFLIDQDLPAIWSELGTTTCAPDLALREPHRLRDAFNRLGDARFAERVTRYAGDLTVESLPTIVLRGLFDAFGYTMNREPMAQLAQAFVDAGGPETLQVGSPEVRLRAAQALLFGLGGFIPFSPPDAHLAGMSAEVVSNVERIWRAHHASQGPPLSPTSWTRARTRPANHPAARLSTLASLFATTGGDPIALLLPAIRAEDDPVDTLIALANQHDAPDLGQPRAIAIMASVILPIAMAWSQHQHDDELEDAVARAWHRLPRSEWSRPARRAREQAIGDAPLKQTTERTVQGLMHLDRAFCSPRRCFECPIAAEVIADHKRRRPASEAVVQSMLPT